jgi:cell division protein FtsQ
MTPGVDPIVPARLADADDLVVLPETLPAASSSTEASPAEITLAEVLVPEGSQHAEAERSPWTSPRTAPARRAHRVVRFAAACGVVVVLVAVVVLRSPLFQARDIQVRGTVHLTRADVLRIAGIAVGTNVATFDAGAAERRLEDDPWVAGAAIAKHLPSTLVVVVHERQAVAVAQVGGVSRLVASDGTLLDAAAAAELLPRIATADPAAPAITIGAVRGAARAIAAMPLDLRRAVAQVAVLTDGGLRVDLTSGAQVVYGPAVQLTAKARALLALLAYAARKGMTVAAADVQVPTAPTAHLVAGDPAGP